MSAVQAAIYARVSSEQQADAHTIASQVAALQERVTADGLVLLPERQFIDAGYSGATLVRPALERLRDLAAAGDLDRLYVHSPDRLARKYAYQVLLLDEWQRAGVEVVFLNRAVGTTPEDELLLQVQGMVAEYERAKILERSRRGKRHAAHGGSVNVLSGAPYGYRYIPKTDGGGQARYEIVLDEARVVRQIFAWVGRDRLTIGEVCRRLTAAGERTRTGKTMWDRATVWTMLRNPAYMGSAAFGKTRAAPLTPQKLRPQRGRPAQPRRAVTTTDVPEAEWLSVPVPPLIDAALFAAVQEQLAANRQHARQQQRGARYLLQGLVVCAACGYAYYGKAISLRAAKGRRRDYAYYRCLGTDAYRFGGERVCANPQVRTDRLDAAVWQAVCELLEQPGRLTAEYQRRRDQPVPEASELTTVETQMNKLRQGLARLIDSYTEGLIDKGEFEPRIMRLRQRLRHYEEQARRLSDELRVQDDLRLLVGQLETFAAQVRQGLEAADWSTCRELIRALVKRVDVESSQVNVVFRVPPAPFGASPETGILPLCRGGERPPLRGPRFGREQRRAVHDARLEPPVDGPPQGWGGVELGQQRRVVDAVETGRDIRVEHVLRLLADRGEDHLDRIVRGAAGAEPERVRLELRFPFRLQGEPHQGLGGAIPQRGDAERSAFRRTGFGNPDPAHGAAGGTDRQVRR
jgi:site-specific DNA recombinase